jgi:FkbM family methyltransferase
MSDNPNRLGFQKIKSIISTRLSNLFDSPFRKFNLNWFQVKYYKHAGKNKHYNHKFRKGLVVGFNDPQAFLLSVRELFIEEIYKFRNTSDSPRIIDCGAHIGMSILFFKVNYPNARIIAFEPDSSNYSLTKKNIESWKFENVELIQKAVWTSNGQILFQHLNDMGSNIVQEETSENSANITRMDCARLKDLLQTETDFVKLDIEGAEYEVIKDCADVLHNAKNIFIEYHGNYDEMHKLSTILNIVTEQGFAYYIKEAGNIYARPFYDREKLYSYDVQLNIFCFQQKS